MKTGIIIQARMGSTRLPGKIMKPLIDKPVLRHVIERVKQVKEADEIIIATTTNKEDDIIEKEALDNNVKVYRGSEDDVLSRYFEAAHHYSLDVIVRITSDCPLIDPLIINDMLNVYDQLAHDVMTNAGIDESQRTFPRGLDTEIFSFSVLKDAQAYAEKIYQREHVTPYLYENTNNIYYYKNSVDWSGYRITLDTKEDFDLIQGIFKQLYEGKHNFFLKDIINVLNEDKALASLNKHVKQKKLER